MPWSPGSPIVQRSVRDRRIRYMRSLTVVEDQDDLVALYLAPGYPCKRPGGVRGGPRGRMLLTDSGRHEDWVWAKNRVLKLYRPGDAHQTQLFWRADDGAFLGWYIDLLEALRRTPIGFDTRDHILDIWVAPDRSSWEWKDEDELEWCLATGELSPQQVTMIRAEGERAVERLTAADPPIYKEWEDWSPDPSWPVPTIPADWNVIFPNPTNEEGPPCRSTSSSAAS